MRIKQPLFSHRAAGQLAKTLIFRKAGRGHTVYPYFKPSQPNTTPQISQREIFRWLTQQWPTLTPTEQQSWSQLVPTLAHSCQHAFIAHNINRWLRFKPPTKLYPAAEIIFAGAAWLTGATGGPRHITWHFNRAMFSYPWGYVLYRNTAPNIVRTAQNTSRIFWVPGVGALNYLDTDLEPDTYYARLSFFTKDGVWMHSGAEKSATAT